MGNYQWTRIDLMTGNFVPQGNCSTGAHEIKSTSPFGLWVWGWGTPRDDAVHRERVLRLPGRDERAAHQQVVIPPMPQ